MSTTNNYYHLPHSLIFFHQAAAGFISRSYKFYFLFYFIFRMDSTLLPVISINKNNLHISKQSKKETKKTAEITLMSAYSSSK